MKLNDALRRAQTLGLDLVEVAPTANPPVCKIIDFGKFRYDISKHTKDKKPASSKLKEIKFRVNIDEHDYLTKIRHGEEFLDRGNKVRVQLQFRGREMAHQEFGMQLVDPKITGRNITMTLAPLPANRRKRKFTAEPETAEQSREASEPVAT
jgi:translation initiation factor IF-3